MGAAKRRGTREQRIAQSIERRKREEAALHERFKIDEARRKAHLAALPPQERKEAVLLAGGGSTHHTRMLLAAMSGLLAAPSTVLIADGNDDIKLP